MSTVERRCLIFPCRPATNSGKTGPRADVIGLAKVHGTMIGPFLPPSYELWENWPTRGCHWSREGTWDNDWSVFAAQLRTLGKLAHARMSLVSRRYMGQ